VGHTLGRDVSKIQMDMIKDKLNSIINSYKFGFISGYYRSRQFNEPDLAE